MFMDTLFKHFQGCLYAEMKRLTGPEVGPNVKEAQALCLKMKNSK